LARRRPKHVLGAAGLRLALFLFLPWALLTVAGGGIHNHALAVTGRQAAADPSCPPGAPGLHQDRAASPDAPCIACLWQLQSGATSHISPDTASEPVVAFRAAGCESCLLETDVLSFDPRAPPLS